MDHQFVPFDFPASIHRVTLAQARSRLDGDFGEGSLNIIDRRIVIELSRHGVDTAEGDMELLVSVVIHDLKSIGPLVNNADCLTMLPDVPEDDQAHYIFDNMADAIRFVSNTTALAWALAERQSKGHWLP